MIIVKFIVVLILLIGIIYIGSLWFMFVGKIFNLPGNPIEHCYMINYPKYGVLNRKHHNQLQGRCLSCKMKFDCTLYKEGKEIK